MVSKLGVETKIVEGENAEMQGEIDSLTDENKIKQLNEDMQRTETSVKKESIEKEKLQSEIKLIEAQLAKKAKACCIIF